jgi:hypothetical protein
VAGWSGGTAASTPLLGASTLGTSSSAKGPRELAVARALVRPNRKGGGTVVVFTLHRSMLLRVTVVRVFPTCEVLGTFRVRGRAGVNRLPFHGRLHGRPLANGTYRLLIGARRTPSAETTIVVARGRVSDGKLRNARRANACAPVLPIGFNSPALSVPASAVTGGGSGGDGIANAVVGAAKGVVKKGEALAGRAKEALTDPSQLSKGFLVAIGMLTLMAAALGGFLLANLYRDRDRLYR